MELSLKQDLPGPILDLGGGGEGIIGLIYGNQVTAIDNRPEELDEAPAGPVKLVMDAAHLAFPDGSFQTVTSFFTLMYMDHDIQRQAISEAARVLRSGGQLHIWDAVIRSAYPSPFLIDLDIDAAGTAIHTTYGVVREDAAQDSRYFTGLCCAAGLIPEGQKEDGGIFHLCFIKPNRNEEALWI